MLSKSQKEEAVQTVKKWVETLIIGLNLCPFAKAPHQRKAIRFAVADSNSMKGFLEAFLKELDFLQSHSHTETTLLIIPALGRMEHFQAFQQFCEETLLLNQLHRTFQIVSFHPNLRFHGLDPQSPENLVGMAPYPIVHILRVASVASLGATVKRDVQLANSERLRKMTIDEMKLLWKKVLD